MKILYIILCIITVMIIAIVDAVLEFNRDYCRYGINFNEEWIQC